MRRLVPGHEHRLGLLGFRLVALPAAFHHNERIAGQTILRREVSRLGCAGYDHQSWERVLQK